MSETLIEHSLETRRRLLDSAGEVFAEKGFARTTIREICKNARTNIAAVNYHFGDKQKLYLAVFADCRMVGENDRPTPAGIPAEAQLREFIRQFLKHLLDSGRPSWFARLLAREMTEPSGALDSFVEEHVRPKQIALQEIVHEILGDLPPRVIAKCAVSVIGQMLHYHFARPVLKRLSPIYADLDQHVEELADHITRFSLGGIRAIAERYQRQS
jgi:TetR/AcrR family transcriptional regulator, regulator of cefoperazone and chloramphenicol sensitivity